MPTEYSYSSTPQPVKPTKKYRNEEEGVTLTLMADPRVVRGSTFANARQMTLARKTAPPLTKISARIEQTTEKSRASYSFEVKSFANSEMDLSQYLVERGVEKQEIRQAESQTEAFRQRPISPVYIPRKTGIDNYTQVDDVSDLFNFDAEVEPLLNVIVQKTLEQSLFEVKSEMEIRGLREEIKVFVDKKAEEDAWVKQKEKETATELSNKQKDVAQKEKENKEKDKIRQTVAGLQKMRQLNPVIFQSIADECFQDGTWSRLEHRSVVDNIIAPVVASSNRNISALKAACDIADGVYFLQQSFYFHLTLVVFAEIISLAHLKYENCPKAQNRAPPKLELTIIVKSSSMTKVGEVLEDEIINDMTIGPISLDRQDTVQDVNKIIKVGFCLWSFGSSSNG